MSELVPRGESRIFAALAVVALPVILGFLPGRLQFVPREIQFLGAAGLAIPMIAAQFAPTNRILTGVERYSAVILLPFITFVQLALLATLLISMTNRHSGMSGVTLLAASIAIWTTNVLVFALAYWHLDRGGPAGRATAWQGRADFSFSRGDPADGVPANWQPIFADYLALAFNTSTAFSPTDALPLTPRAKMLMLIQSIISLVTVITVGARAINILGN